MDPLARADSVPLPGEVRQQTPTMKRWGWLFAAPWLVFLVIQVINLVNSDRPPWQIALAITLLTIFAGCFLTPFIAFSSAVLAGTTDHPLAWVPPLAMAVIVVVSIPLLSWWVTMLLPYLVACLAFNVAPRIALPIASAMFVVLVIALWAGGMLHEMVYAIVVTGLVAIANFTTVAMIQRTGQEEELLAERERLRERDRLGRDLHDLLGHSLTVIAVKAELAEAMAETSPQAAKSEIVQIRELTRDALSRVRFAVGQMRESTVSEEIAGLEVSFAGTGTTLEIIGEPDDLAPRLQRVLGWIVREACTNVLRHADAQHCRITWQRRGVQITDDGRGTDLAITSAPPGTDSPGPGPSSMADDWSGAGNGVRNMASRAAEVGARFSIGPAAGNSLSGRGTTVEVRW